MKFERSYRNYLPLKIKFFTSVILFLIFLPYTVYHYYPLISSVLITAKIEKVKPVQQFLSGKKDVTITLLNQREPTILFDRSLPFYYQLGDTIQVYHHPKLGYQIYDPINLFAICPVVTFGLLILINKFSKKEVIEI